MTDFVEWRDIPGLEGRYQVSECGYIRSLKSRTHPGCIRSQWANKAGYLTFCYIKDGKRKSFLVHRAVALAFVPNPDKKPVVNHIDGDPSNNHRKNLEWVTQGENVEHSRKQGKASKYIAAKLKIDQVKEIRNQEGCYSASFLAGLYNVTPHTIRNMWRRRSFSDV